MASLQDLVPENRTRKSTLDTALIFTTGKISQVIPTIAQGQLKPDPTGNMIDFDEAARLGRQGRVPVKIEVLDDRSDFQLPAGAKADVAAYSNQWKAFSIVRRILLRMKSWQK